MNLDPHEQGFRSEVRRKLIHMAFGLIPISYAVWISKTGMLILLGMAVFTLLIVEWLRRLPGTTARELFHRWFQTMLRKKERERGFLGITHYVIAALFVIAVFPEPAAVLAMLFLAVGDASASLIGLLWGSHKLGRKSLEGTLAFWLAVSLVTVIAWLLDSDYPLVGGLLAAPIAALAENVTPGAVDNWTVPVLSAIVIVTASALAG